MSLSTLDWGKFYNTPQNDGLINLDNTTFALADEDTSSTANAGLTEISDWYHSGFITKARHSIEDSLFQEPTKQDLEKKAQYTQSQNKEVSSSLLSGITQQHIIYAGIGIAGFYLLRGK